MARLTAVLLLLALVFAPSGISAQTLADTIADDEELSTLNSLISVAGLGDALADPNAEYTVFAPTNEAFAFLLADFPELAVLTEDAALANLALSYHVANGVIDLESFSNATTIEEKIITTLLANVVTNLTVNPNITVEVGADGIVLAGIAPGALVLDNGTIVGKSIIYKIEDVLLPVGAEALLTNDTVANTVAGVLEADEDLSLLLQLVGLDENLVSIASNEDLVVTLFAPTNAAITAALESLNVTLEQIQSTPQVAQAVQAILYTHVLGERAYTAGLLTTGDYATSLDNVTVSVDATDTSTTVQAEGNDQPINVDLNAIPAGKSVVYKIDGVLLPPVGDAPSPSPSPEQAPTEGYASIYDALTPLGLTTLKVAVDAAGGDVATTFKDPSVKGIVLAPSNAALEAVLTKYPGLLALALTNPEIIQSLISFHIIPTEEANQELDLSANTTTLATQLTATANPVDTNANLTFKVQPDSEEVWVGGLAPGGLINATFFAFAGNATVYVVDALLLPPSSTISLAPDAPAPFLTISDALNNSTELSLLYQLIESSEAIDALAHDSNTAVTIFAPTDAALTASLESLNVTVEELLAQPDLVSAILLNHVIPTRPYTSAQLNGTVEVPSANNGSLLTITAADGNVTVQGVGNDAPIPVTTADVLAGKSAIHIIDGVILPDLSGDAPAPAPAPAPVPAGGTNTNPPVIVAAPNAGSLTGASSLMIQALAGLACLMVMVGGRM